jgi:hypothetical protein
MEPSINYVIATYAGLSKRREKSDKGITPFILQMHLDKLIELLPTTSMIKQITITKPTVRVGTSYSEYYQIEDKISIIENQYNIPVKFVDMINYRTGVSYSQYRRAFQEYPDFDFYILMEDDWIPNQNGFDALLINEWMKRFASKDDNAYLCLWYVAIQGFKQHAAISVGIISNKALTELGKWCKMDVELDQFRFSKALEHIGTEVKDFSYDGNNWRILFWETSKGVIYDFSHKIKNKECLLAPLHYILKDKYDFKIVPK